MKAIAEKTTVVLAGAFNPAILSPRWVAVHGLGHPPEHEFQVEMLAPVLGGGGQNRFTFDGISYSVGFRSLTLHLDATQVPQCERAVRAVADILRQLPHTPVTGLGFNFAFLVEQPSPQLLAFMTTHDALTQTFPGAAEVVVRRWGNSIQWSEALVNVDCELAGGQLVVQFNLHYSTASAGQAEAILRGEHAFETHRSRAVEAARALTGQDLEE